MKHLYISIVLAAASVAGQSHSSATSQPKLLHSQPAQVPADDCFSRDYTCEARFSFMVKVDGRVSDVEPIELPRSYPCVRSLIRSISDRVYAAQPEPLHLEEHVVGYQCENGRPANSSFKPMPLRGTA